MIQPSFVREAAYPLVLASLIPHLKAAGFGAEGCDVDFGEFPRALRAAAAGRFCAVIVSLLDSQSGDAVSIVKRLKAVSPGLPVILVGARPTLSPEETLIEVGADMALRGDPERLAADSLACLFEGSPCPQGAAVRRGDRIEVIGDPRHDTDPDAIGPVDRDTFPLLRYGHAYRSVRYPHAAMTSSRGCDCHCPHCPLPRLRPQGFAARSIESVVDEMESLAGSYGIRDVHFEDDAFWTSNDRAGELCEELIRRNSGLIWELVNGIRPEHVDVRLLPLMARAGLRRMALGVEAVYENSPPPQGELWQPAGRIRRIVDAAHEAGISTTGYFILGLPCSTPERDEAMIGLSQGLGLDMVHYSPYRELPGSRYAADGVSPDRDPDETLAMLHRAYRRFYLTPAQMAWLASELLGEPALLPAMVTKVLLELVGLRPGRF